MTPAAGTVIADRFRLTRPLGEGGMGSVWLAEHLGLDVLCAVKLIQADARGSDEVRRRFEREAKIAAQIRSPHVVHILDHGVWEETPYIVMEYLEGEDLEQRLSRVGRLSPAETASIIAQVARALNRAHVAGLVHRDLKPANIFLARDDDREIVKVLDFGIAKDVTPKVASTTRTGSVLGTPAYMSPEQAQGVKAVDHRSDLWSLAVLVFECLTGQLPFVSDAFGDLLLKIMVQPLPVPSQIAEVPPGFDAWWTHAAMRDPEQRFQSAREMVEALIFALGLSAGSGVQLRTSISGSFEIPLFDRASSPSLNPGAIAADRASSPTVEVVSVEGTSPPLSDATTLVATADDAQHGRVAVRITPREGPTPAPVAVPASQPDTGSEAAPVARARHPTTGPVSTSLETRPEPRRSMVRVVIGALAGIAVAGTVAFLLLRGGPAPEAAAVPTTPAEPPAVAPPEAPVAAEAKVAEPGAPTPTAPSAGAAPPAAPENGLAEPSARPGARPGAGTVQAPPSTSRPPPPSTSTTKKRDPRDLGI